MTNRKMTPGEFRAVGPEISTSPAPPETDIEAKIVEIHEALERFGELADELGQLLRGVRVAQLASEHRANVQRAKTRANRLFLADHERRLREVERFQAGLTADAAAGGAE